MAPIGSWMVVCCYPYDHYVRDHYARDIHARAQYVCAHWPRSLAGTVSTLDGHVMDVAWQTADRFASCTSGGAIQLFSLSYPDPVRTWGNAHGTEINIIEWNGVADVLASASADKTMKLWREASEDAVMSYEEHSGDVYQVGAYNLALVCLPL